METKTIEIAVRNELGRISTPELEFHSGHEAWAVLLEEVEEIKAELIGIEDATEELKQLVFADEFRVHQTDVLEDIKLTAVNCAAEAVQVAAVACKFIRMLQLKEEKDA